MFVATAQKIANVPAPELHHENDSFLKIVSRYGDLTLQHCPAPFPWQIEKVVLEILLKRLHQNKKCMIMLFTAWTELYSKF